MPHRFRVKIQYRGQLGGGASTSEQTMVTLSVVDGELRVPLDVASLMTLVKTAVGKEPTDDTTVVPILNVDLRMLQRVVAFCQRCVAEPTEPVVVKKPVTGDLGTSVRPPWCADFVSPLDEAALVQLATAANYLDCEPLLELVCAALAIRVLGRPPPTGEGAATHCSQGDYRRKECEELGCQYDLLTGLCQSSTLQLSPAILQRINHFLPSQNAFALAELAFQREKMQRQLERAARSVEKGDREVMEYYLTFAQELAAETGTDISVRVAQIRSSLTPEKEAAFMAREVEDPLQRAARSAEKGDKNMMEISLAAAQKAAVETGTDISARVAQIRSSFAGDREAEYVSRRVEEDLERAATFAENGNRRYMELYLRNAQRRAAEGTVPVPDVPARVAQIRSSLTPEKEAVFMVRDVEDRLQKAARFAESGNQIMMEVHLDNAQEIAKRTGTDISARVSEVGQVYERFKNGLSF